MYSAIQYIVSIQTELNKVSASSFHLDDFLYFVNKGTQEYLNIAYRLFETTQQITDDLSTLKNRKVYVASNGDITNNISITQPNDYWHLSELSLILNDTGNTKCYPAGNTIKEVARRKTRDMDGFLQRNYFGQPNKHRVFYEIFNNNVITIEAGQSTTLNIVSIQLDYLSKPIKMVLPQTIFDTFVTTGVDNSQISTFPDYVDAEIVKQVVKLFLENQGNQRLSTNIPVNQSIR